MCRHCGYSFSYQPGMYEGCGADAANEAAGERHYMATHDGLCSTCYQLREKIKVEADSSKASKLQAEWNKRGG